MRKLDVLSNSDQKQLQEASNRVLNETKNGLGAHPRFNELVELPSAFFKFLAETMDHHEQTDGYRAEYRKQMIASIYSDIQTNHRLVDFMKAPIKFRDLITKAMEENHKNTGVIETSDVITKRVIDQIDIGLRVHPRFNELVELPSNFYWLMFLIFKADEDSKGVPEPPKSKLN